MHLSDDTLTRCEVALRARVEEAREGEQECANPSDARERAYLRFWKSERQRDELALGEVQRAREVQQEAQG